MDSFTFVSPIAPTHLTPDEIAELAFLEPVNPFPGDPAFEGINMNAGAQYEVAMAYYSNDGAGMISTEMWGFYIAQMPEVDWAGMFTLAPMV